MNVRGPLTENLYQNCSGKLLPTKNLGMTAKIRPTVVDLLGDMFGNLCNARHKKFNRAIGNSASWHVGVLLPN